ncbi:hypothetical protein CT0861_03034 [Colletotrichum tofieldiae]|uniref:Uncharacterized protein n=1 Tax=Colletotrichum tofieldiae TaxID=708197 RepID=A0A166YJW3_9PEZI|nr:hypothetical protein CT0861_03034 [Colletotrichum tofieldiae]
MDPFNKLPAELRIELLISTWCPRTISQLIQASPAMLAQFTISKGYITRKLLAPDFDDGMVQDAIAIVLFPSQSTSDFKTLARHHCLTWATQRFTNPFYQPLESQNQDLVNKISKLHTGLVFFIEDYLTKATAVFPPREYLCLSSRTEPQLKFKGQAVGSRFNAANLTVLERKRLLRAFLRYQLECLMDDDIKQLCEEALYQHSGQEFQPWELQAVLCVGMYLKTLYGAMFAQCSDSWLPEVVLGSTSPHPPGLLYPDSLRVDPDAYAYDMGCRRRDVASALSEYGFDLVAILLRSARAGQPGRDRLKKWFLDFRPRNESRWVPLHYYRQLHEFLGAEEEGSQNGPGMYQMLHSRIVQSYHKLAGTYLQRAWVFFDDDRFYPSPSPDAKPHFPTEDEALDERFQNEKKDEDWSHCPWRARAQHRSLKWHNKQRGISPEKTEVEDYQDAELEKGRQVSLPDVVDGTHLSALRPFWQ